MNESYQNKVVGGIAGRLANHYDLDRNEVSVILKKSVRKGKLSLTDFQDIEDFLVGNRMNLSLEQLSNILKIFVASSKSGISTAGVFDLLFKFCMDS